jgi:hypothetical protein
MVFLLTIIYKIRLMMRIVRMMIIFSYVAIVGLELRRREKSLTLCGIEHGFLDLLPTCLLYYNYELSCIHTSSVCTNFCFRSIYTEWLLKHAGLQLKIFQIFIWSRECVLRQLSGAHFWQILLKPVPIPKARYCHVRNIFYVTLGRPIKNT